IQTAIERLDRSIAATQLGVTFASVGLGWLGEPAFARLLQPWFEALPGAWSLVATHSAATAIAFVVITFMHVVFGELIPKNLALQAPDRTALWLVPREKMATLELSTAPEQVLESVRTGAHTRMPVYEGAFDNIVGIVNTKDLFHLFSLKGVVILQDAMYPPLFLKPTNTVAEAL